MLATATIPRLTHLDRLEAESIHILRETVAEADKPVMLYSIGKDSAVMLHLAKKAFFPSPLPFPLLHVDTTWKFRDMYALREKVGADSAIELLVYKNPEAVEKGINPFDHGPLHTDMWKTEGLKQALDLYQFDAAFGGARRDEEKSRAKERVFSFRDRNHRWDPKRQRPELWLLYNVRKNKGESIRVFPLSNWTELDVWQYILRETIEIVPLYFAADRPTVERDGLNLIVDDGKSTLIGRLLYESKQIFDDQLAALESDSKRHGTQGEKIDFALLVDGLSAEREQGITIDVAYRFFSSARRKFIVADTPGHEQYTRNMATGASTAELAIILVDATKGVLPQTRRHAYIASLLGISHVVAAINKMDLVSYRETVFLNLSRDFAALANRLGLRFVKTIPLSALAGDNVVEPSTRI